MAAVNEAKKVDDPLSQEMGKVTVVLNLPTGLFLNDKRIRTARRTVAQIARHWIKICPSLGVPSCGNA